MITPPNYTQVPNVLLDSFPSFTLSEIAVLMVICRQTFGWQRESAQLSLSFLEKSTGLHKETASIAITSLLSKKIISRIGIRQTFSYRLVLDRAEIPSSGKNGPGGNSVQLRGEPGGNSVQQPGGNSDPNKETNKETKKKEKGGELPDLPARLKTAETERAWKEWKQHRREKKQALTPLTASKNLNALEEWGPDRWVKAIDYTIGKGWSGMFEPPAPAPSSNIPFDPFANCRPAERVIAGKF